MRQLWGANKTRNVLPLRYFHIFLFIPKGSGPIIESDGKVRHFKSLDEKIPDKQVQGKTVVCR